MKKQRINSPEGVALLMENIWRRHQNGMGQRKNNVFFVDLPTLTEEEKQNCKSKVSKRELKKKPR